MGICAAQEKAPAVVAEVVRESKVVCVTVLSARGLRDSHWYPNEKCLLACTATVTGKDSVVHRTKQMKDLPNPTWREEFIIKDYNEGDNLEFSILETIGGRRDLLARTVVESSRFDPKGFCGELRLDLADEDAVAFLKVKVKLMDDEYPMEPPQDFPVVFTNAKRQPLGIEYDLQDKTCVYVANLKDSGVVSDYNSSAQPEQRLMPGDFIMKVNKVEGEALKMIQEMKNCSRLEMLVRHPMEMIVAISIPEDDEVVAGPDRKKINKCTCGGQEAPKKNKFGIEFNGGASGVQGMNLIISKVLEGGAVEDWNNCYPEQEVRAGDRIIAVNGEKGKAEDLKKKIEAVDRFHATIVRPAASEDERGELSGSAKKVKWGSGQEN
mmetsp:Transcript_29600/g.92446  ORF Transcript_29600/g.92446 Transcript_29600/m.92446 type:complete len:380 (+) Transcript_29600:114-1253(+)